MIRPNLARGGMCAALRIATFDPGSNPLVSLWSPLGFSWAAYFRVVKQFLYAHC